MRQKVERTPIPFDYQRHHDRLQAFPKRCYRSDRFPSRAPLEYCNYDNEQQNTEECRNEALILQQEKEKGRKREREREREQKDENREHALGKGSSKDP